MKFDLFKQSLSLKLLHTELVVIQYSSYDRKRYPIIQSLNNLMGTERFMYLPVDKLGVEINQLIYITIRQDMCKYLKKL